MTMMARKIRNNLKKGLTVPDQANHRSQPIQSYVLICLLYIDDTLACFNTGMRIDTLFT